MFHVKRRALMPQILKISNTGVFPSGEEFDYSFWFADILGTDVSATQAADICTAFSGSVGVSAGWRALYSAATTFNAPSWALVDEATGVTTVTGINGLAYTGSSIVEPLPPNLSPCVTLRTARAGASYRGRFYLPAWNVDTVDSVGRIAGASVTAALTALSAAFTSAEAVSTGVNLVVYSRTHRMVNEVVQLDMGNVWDVQRRRRDKLVEVRQTQLV
jgi:hypothetical protein